MWHSICLQLLFSPETVQSDLIHTHAHTGVHQVSVCWAMMSKADFLLCVDPKSHLPSWPRQLPSQGLITSTRGGDDEVVMVHSETLQSMCLKINQKTLYSCNHCNFIWNTLVHFKKHKGLDFHKCCSFLHVFCYHSSLIFCKDFYFNVTCCISFPGTGFFFVYTQISRLFL